MEWVTKKSLRTKEHLNELYLEVKREDFKDVAVYMSYRKQAMLRLMFATDERGIDGRFRIYTVFSIPGIDRFYIIVLPLEERLEDTGRLSKDIAQRLGVTGVAARASGINDDIRKAHPHLLYDRLEFESHTMTKGDVFARMMVRAEETECSVSMINTLLESNYKGELSVEVKDIPAYSYALGYTETPRGSVFYWVMSDKNGRPYRVKLRSPSYCNWPAVPFAVHGNIVPDFPLCNKSFNLSYSGTDM